MENVDTNTGEVIDTEPIPVVQSSIIPYDKPDSLEIVRDPKDVLDDAHKAASALMEVVSSKKKPVTFNGETYLESGDWQTVAKFYGVTAKVESTRYVEYGDAKGFEAAAVALNCNGCVVSRGEAMCLNDEENWGTRAKYEWVDKLDGNGKKIWNPNLRDGKGSYERIKKYVGETPVPLFQLRSMAQTRACAKALSNVFKWVVVLAGYKPTPAEEMEGVFAEETHQDISETRAVPAPPPSRTEPDIRPRSQKEAQPITTQPSFSPVAPETQQNAPQGEVVSSEPPITEKQGKMLFAIQKSLELTDEELKQKIESIGIHVQHRNEIPKHRFNDVLNAIDKDQRFHTNKPR